MELQSCIDAVVRTGIQAYIGLLCCGEQGRSRRLFADTMQISSLAAGGPSARLPVAAGFAVRDGAGTDDHEPSGRESGVAEAGVVGAGATTGAGAGATTGMGAGVTTGTAIESGAASLGGILIFFTLRSLLGSLLVLRATVYWSRVPSLGDLQEACIALNRCLAPAVPHRGGRPEDGAPDYACRS